MGFLQRFKKSKDYKEMSDSVKSVVDASKRAYNSAKENIKYRNSSEYRQAKIAELKKKYNAQEQKRMEVSQIKDLRSKTSLIGKATRFVKENIPQTRTRISGRATQPSLGTGRDIIGEQRPSVFEPSKPIINAREKKSGTGGVFSGMKMKRIKGL